MRHSIVYARTGTFCGWPANNGLWAWDGREFLVGFTVGACHEQPGHNILEPYRSALARSVDRGETWRLVEPLNFVGRCGEVQDSPGDIDFAARGAALRVIGTSYHGSSIAGGAFLVSADRGDTWQGPYSFGALMQHPELQDLEITSRTDYVVDGPEACLLMMSARVPGQIEDRVFCARTTDSGRSFHFVSWVVPPTDPYRALMPATVRCRSGVLVTAVRRRESGTERCWIDAYASADDGETWDPLGKVRDNGPWNGNPPALIELADGRLCCAFGERRLCRVIARFSADQGQTWSRDLILRSDFVRDSFGDPDLGYVRLAQRDDGKLIAIYYWATRENPHHHIAATIWDPK
jgi:hypothetical protein